MKMKRALAALGLTGAAVVGTLAMTATPAAASYNEYIGTYSTWGQCQSNANWWNEHALQGHYYYCAAREAGGVNLWRNVQ